MFFWRFVFVLVIAALATAPVLFSTSRPSLVIAVAVFAALCAGWLLHLVESVSLKIVRPPINTSRQRKLLKILGLARVNGDFSADVVPRLSSAPLAEALTEVDSLLASHPKMSLDSGPWGVRERQRFAALHCFKAVLVAEQKQKQLPALPHQRRSLDATSYELVVWAARTLEKLGGE